ncbi:MAG: hypothetical protein ACJAXX_000614 [Roseivirga sp.]|jgi:hypothetical protein
MKNKFILGLLLIPGLLFVSCDDDEDEPVIPEVPTCVAEMTSDNLAAGTIDLNMSGSLKMFDAFGGRSTNLVDNPDFVGNESCKVMQWVATASPCEVWGGAGWRIGNEPGAGPNAAYGTGGPLDFDNVSGTFTLDVWGAAGTAVTLRLERLGFPDVDPVQPLTQTKTAAGWETLTFAFVPLDLDQDGVTDRYESIIMYINEGVCPAADETYYVDNFTQAGS